MWDSRLRPMPRADDYFLNLHFPFTTFYRLSVLETLCMPSNDLSSLAFTLVATADNCDLFIDYCAMVFETSEFNGDTRSLSA